MSPTTSSPKSKSHSETMASTRNSQMHLIYIALSTTLSYTSLEPYTVTHQWWITIGTLYLISISEPSNGTSSHHATYKSLKYAASLSIEINQKHPTGTSAASEGRTSFKFTHQLRFLTMVWYPDRSSIHFKTLWTCLFMVHQSCISSRHTSGTLIVSEGRIVRFLAGFCCLSSLFNDDADDEDDDRPERPALSFVKAFWKSVFSSLKRVFLIFCSSGVPFSR